MERPVDLRRDVGVPRNFEVVATLRRVVHLEHPARGIVHQLQPSLRRDDHDAFTHAVEDGFHPRAVGLALGRAAADLAHRLVEDARHESDFIGAVVARGRGQIARGVAFRHFGDRANAATQERGRAPREHEGCQKADRQGHHCGTANRRELLADFRQGKREPYLGQLRSRRAVDFDGDVQHVGLQRRAVAARDPEPLATRLLNLRPSGMVLERRQLVGGQLRITHDRAIRTDERHARGYEPADRIRLGVELRRGCGLPMGQRFGRQARFIDQAALDALVETAADRPRHESRRDEQRDGGGEK